MNNAGNQAADFLDQANHLGDNPPPHDPLKGQVPFPSALRLTREQEDRMVEHASRRILQLESESGRNLVTRNTTWFSTSQNMNQDRYSFMGRRSIWELTYQNKVWWRKFALGGIYKESNLLATLSRRITRQMTARAVNYYFGTDPWFAAYPIGGDREELAEELDQYSQFKTERSKLKSCMAKAIEGAFVRGESVVKTVWETEEQLYQQNANVLVDQNGHDILDVNGDWITDKDAFMDETQSQVDPGPGPNAGKPIPGTKQLTGRRVLRRDMITPEPQPKMYQQKLITRRLINFAGARSDVVYWQDFLCPQTAHTVQTADIVVHLSDMPVIKLINMYQRKDMLQETPAEEKEATTRAIQLLQRLAAASGQPKTALGQARPDIGETSGLVGWEETEPKVQIAECYMTFDANQDGQTEEIYLTYDRQSKLPIYYDYLPNVTPDGQRPFDVVRVQPIDGRWYGLGAMEMFDKSQRTVDLLPNRWNLSQSQAGRVTFWKPSNTLEGDRTPNLKLNMGNTYTLKDEKTMEETLGFVTLPEVKGEDIEKMMQFFQQLMMNESGITNVNDGASAGLDTAKLATGVKNMQNQGEEMFSLYIGSLEPSLEDITRRNLRLEFANMNPTEIYSFFEGDQHKVGVLQSEDVADLDVNVSILLTRYKNQQLLQSALQAVNSGQQFYQSSPEVQQRLAPLYIQVLKALQIDDPGSIIVALPGQPTMAMPAGQPGQAAAPGQPSPQPATGAPQPQAQPAPSGASSPVKPILPNKFLWKGKTQ